MKIIDAHIHFRPELEGFQQTAKLAGHENSQKHLMAEWQKNNIVHGIVMSNLNLLLEDHQYPSNMSYCIGLDSHILTAETIDITQFIVMIEKHLNRNQCVGIKLYPGYCPYYVYDEIFFPLYALAQKYNKPVAVHTGATSRSDAFLKYSHPSTIDEVAAKFSKVQFILCHFGNPFIVDAAAVINKNPNVAVDLSGILEGNPAMEDFLVENQDYVRYIKMWLSYINDFSKIMFGTDWPLIHISSYITFIKKLIPAQHHQAVFFENANRIYNLKLD